LRTETSKKKRLRRVDSFVDATGDEVRLMMSSPADANAEVDKYRDGNDNEQLSGILDDVLERQRCKLQGARYERLDVRIGQLSFLMQSKARRLLDRISSVKIQSRPY
jgi:hypothetical protein